MIVPGDKEEWELVELVNKQAARIDVLYGLLREAQDWLNVPPADEFEDNEIKLLDQRITEALAEQVSA